jgi:hypothetical protein
MKKRLLVVPLALALVLLFATTSIAFADAPDPVDNNEPVFLCPVVGDGVNTADSHNGDNGVAAIDPPVGTSLIPGNNQAGEKANDLAPGGPGPGTGPGSEGFSPIWDTS